MNAASSETFCCPCMKDMTRGYYETEYLNIFPAVTILSGQLIANGENVLKVEYKIPRFCLKIRYLC